jgi:hypothetical protein
VYLVVASEYNRANMSYVNRTTMTTLNPREKIARMIRMKEIKRTRANRALSIKTLKVVPPKIMHRMEKMPGETKTELSIIAAKNLKKRLRYSTNVVLCGHLHEPLDNTNSRRRP